ncbi:MAG: redoxin family protein [Kiritimatiellae bacterium]|nr:redoxin family protein [Kiritimatiellia bacterium]
MALITESGPETLSIGSKGPTFNLPATDGTEYSLQFFKESKAVVISFTCNHCPYAKAYEDRFIDLTQKFTSQGIAFVAINSNDDINYPDDSFENMKIRAKNRNFPFPYLRDHSQEIAKAYGAVCTPHFFVLNQNKSLVYEGRLDDNWKEPSSVTSRDLYNAVEAIVMDNPVSTPNTNPMGCSIKWK